MLRAFDPYVQELERLASGSIGDGEDLAVHLDGEAGRRLRSVVPINELRRLGAFFTGDVLAARLVACVPTGSVERYFDPACGCGDLLLAASERLAVLPSLEETLRTWNGQLGGRDLVPQFVRAARARLAVAAITRGARPTEGHARPADLLSEIAVGDGLQARFDEGTAVLVNPPYGQVVAPQERTWTSGLTTEAAIFLDMLLDACAPGVHVAAVLPEVLRAGSRYARLRASIEDRLRIATVEPCGMFDALTDVDVFLLAGVTDPSVAARSVAWTPPVPSVQLQDICDVRVGAVVANRDPHRGPWRLYVDARDPGGATELRPTRHRRFAGTVFMPPFVVVGRTNRPVLQGPRLRPTTVVGDGSVAVENHLIALVPHDGSLASCKRIVTIMGSSRASAFLDGRLRCRHLTVAALREVPR